jgi:hypothetical protein
MKGDALGLAVGKKWLLDFFDSQRWRLEGS